MASRIFTPYPKFKVHEVSDPDQGCFGESEKGGGKHLLLLSWTPVPVMGKVSSLVKVVVMEIECFTFTCLALCRS